MTKASGLDQRVPRISQMAEFAAISRSAQEESDRLFEKELPEPTHRRAFPYTWRLSLLADLFDKQVDMAQAIIRQRRVLALHDQLPDAFLHPLQTPIDQRLEQVLQATLKRLRK